MSSGWFKILHWIETLCWFEAIALNLFPPLGVVADGKNSTKPLNIFLASSLLNFQQASPK